MAWVTEYDMTWRSGNASGTIVIQRDGGSYQRGLSIRRDSLELRTHLPDWESQIVRQNCSFTVLNDLDDFYELIPLMTISAGQLKVIVEITSPQSAILFEGYMNCEAVNQQMLNNADLRFMASGLLDKLQWESPDTIDDLQNRSLIGLINDCLRLTGSEYDIWVNCSLYESNAPLGEGQTLFNRTGAFTELFWENNIDQMSALDILKTILRTFNCYLFWYDQKWFIEHYEDLGASTKTYVRYYTFAYYDHGSSGSQQLTAVAQYNVHEPIYRSQANTSQILTVSPGLKRYDITLNQKQFFNLLQPDLSDASDTIEDVPIPDWR
ncbi:hypothetical protein LCGC14_2626290, partial [marine sediment metagenome]